MYLLKKSAADPHVIHTLRQIGLPFLKTFTILVLSRLLTCVFLFSHIHMAGFFEDVATCRNSTVRKILSGQRVAVGLGARQRRQGPLLPATT